jgi:GT2 family glycosyltransferase
MKGLAVLIPVYCNSCGLNRSLESLRAASGSFGVVIVDDGNPEPIALPAHLREGVTVTVLRLAGNQGIARALNHGLRYILARGYTCIARLDAGDTVATDRFDRQLRFLEANPQCAVVSSFVDFVGPDQTVLFHYRAPARHPQILRRMRLNSCLLHPATMLRSDALQTAGLYREDSPGAEDYELFLRLSRRFTLAVLPAVLTRCEYSPRGLSVTGRRQQQEQRLKLQIRYFDPLSPYSFYGVIRTLIAMLAPHSAVFRFKRAYFRV